MNKYIRTFTPPNERNSYTFRMKHDYDVNGNVYSDRYSNAYKYHIGSNRLEEVNGGLHGFKWDANGNLLFHADGQRGHKRRHYWDEENRMMLAADEDAFGYYLYDAGGERAYKFNGGIGSGNVNGQWHNYAVPTAATLYASPYLAANLHGYTKHYYAGGERIASKLGGGGIPDINGSPFEVGPKQNLSILHYERLGEECLGLALPCSTYLHYSIGEDRQRSAVPERDLYFYHPDHLGSASWITDASGDAIQHLQYLPFGETRLDQRATGWNAPYTFSGKERDEETGYGYFGARYYDSDLSIWLSVDPLASKYPHQTNYVYCSNNPLRIIDLDGRDEYEFDGVGNLTNVKKSEYDSFHKIDADGNRTGESLSFEKKIVSDEFTIEGESRNSNYLRVDNGNDADAVFSFLSDHVEMEGGEFSNSFVSNSQGEQFNLIGADVNAVAGESYSSLNLLKSGGYDVKTSTHNHKWGKTSPSPSDLYYPSNYPNTNFMIYTKGNFCTPFDKNTPADTENLFSLPQIEIKGSRR